METQSGKRGPRGPYRVKWVTWGIWLGALCVGALLALFIILWQRGTPLIPMPAPNTRAPSVTPTEFAHPPTFTVTPLRVTPTDEPISTVVAMPVTETRVPTLTPSATGTASTAPPTATPTVLIVEPMPTTGTGEVLMGLYGLIALGLGLIAFGVGMIVGERLVKRN